MGVLREELTLVIDSVKIFQHQNLTLINILLNLHNCVGSYDLIFTSLRDEPRQVLNFACSSRKPVRMVDMKRTRNLSLLISIDLKSATYNPTNRYMTANLRKMLDH